MPNHWAVDACATSNIPQKNLEKVHCTAHWTKMASHRSRLVKWSISSTSTARCKAFYKRCSLEGLDQLSTHQSSLRFLKRLLFGLCSVSLCGLCSFRSKPWLFNISACSNFFCGDLKRVKLPGIFSCNAHTLGRQALRTHLTFTPLLSRRQKKVQKLRKSMPSCCFLQEIFFFFLN